MERLRILKERFLKFRYRGMLVVTLVFALITAILFIERSGISYNYNIPYYLHFAIDGCMGKKNIPRIGEKHYEKTFSKQVFSVVVSIRDDLGYAAGQRNGSRPDSQGCRY